MARKRMAKKTGGPKATQKSTVKFKGKSQFSKKRYAIIFVAVFAMVGAALLLRSFASPVNEGSEIIDNSIIDYTISGATIANISSNSSISLNRVPVQVRLMKDGQLICNNGTGDSVNTVQLTADQSQAIHDTTVRLLGHVSQRFVGIPTDGGQVSVNPISIGVSDGNGHYTQSVTVDAAAQKPPAFQAVETYLRAQCIKATIHSDLSKIVSFHTAKPRWQISLADAFNWFSPQVFAYPNARIDQNISIYLQQDFENDRKSVGSPPLNWSHCEGDDAANAALWEVATGVSGDPPFDNLKNCGYARNTNVGAISAVVNCQPSDKAWADKFNKAYLGSPLHKHIIEDPTYHYDGQGFAYSHTSTDCIGMTTGFFSGAKLEYPGK